MDDGDTKLCENCKREVPRANFTTHAAHCARNVRLCPACDQPVPAAELRDHHDRMHEPAPCAQCGERVCGGDLEDHVRDSCAHTMKSCRFCALELRRGELPPHERYCGARTERCEQCGERVMHRYRQLHLDSNHGFIRLNEDPVPSENALKTTTAPKSSSSNINSTENDLNLPNTNLNRPLTEIRFFPYGAVAIPNTCTSQYVSDLHDTTTPQAQHAPGHATVAPGAPRARQETFIPKTSTSQYFPLNIPNSSRSQINGQIPASVSAASRANETSSTAASPAASPAARRDARNADPATNSATADKTNPACSVVSDTANGLSFRSQSRAVPRAKRSNHQPQVNTSTAAPDKVNKNLWASRGAVKKRPAPPPPQPAPPPPQPAPRELALGSALRRQQDEEAQRRAQTAYNLSVGLPPVLSAAAKLDKLRKMDALQNGNTDDQDYKNILQGRVWRSPELPPAGNVLGASGGQCAAPELRELAPERRRRELSNLQPMSPEQFLQRFSEMQMSDSSPPRSGDRFDQIKSSLRELRRGLNEVTAPYNSSASDSNDKGAGGAGGAGGARRCSGEVRLPCEFCGAPVPRDHLVQHQTGCRPDLTQYRPKSRSGSRPESRSASRSESRDVSPSAVIPCEFCSAPLPVYLISEHQERCGRAADLLLPD